MSDEPISGISRIHPDVLKAQQAAETRALKKYLIQQQASKTGFTEWSELSAFNPFAMSRDFRSLEKRLLRREQEEEAEQAQKTEEKKILSVERLTAAAERYYQRNAELKVRDLLDLRSRLKDGDTPEEIINKVLETYSDYSLADEALDFLLETSEGGLAANVRRAKEEFNARFSREILAGRNMGAQSRAYGAQGLDTPPSLRDLYRDITGNPREAPTLFDELSHKYSFEKMKPMIDFLLHSLGADLHAFGSSIARAELHRIMTEIRVLQAILGIYRFFKSRMRLIRGAFARAGLLFPDSLTFDELSKLFMKFVQERYPSSEKVLQLAGLLGISEEEVAQIIIFMQMRDGMRQVSPRLFKSEKHRQDLLSAFMDALEDLEEQMEEEE